MVRSHHKWHFAIGLRCVVSQLEYEAVMHGTFQCRFAEADYHGLLENSGDHPTFSDSGMLDVAFWWKLESLFIASTGTLCLFR